MDSLTLLTENIALFEATSARIRQAGGTYSIHPAEPMAGGISLARGTFQSASGNLAWSLECLRISDAVSIIYRTRLSRGASMVEIVRLSDIWLANWRLLEHWPLVGRTIFSRFVGLPRPRRTIGGGFPLSPDQARINCAYLVNAILPEEDSQTPPYGTPLPEAR